MADGAEVFNVLGVIEGYGADTGPMDTVGVGVSHPPSRDRGGGWWWGTFLEVHGGYGFWWWFFCGWGIRYVTVMVGSRRLRGEGLEQKSLSRCMSWKLYVVEKKIDSSCLAFSVAFHISGELLSFGGLIRRDGIG